MRVSPSGPAPSPWRARWPRGLGSLRGGGAVASTANRGPPSYAPPRHRRDSSNARTPLATVVADALVDVRLEGVLVIRHFFLRAGRAGAVVEVQGHASSRRRRAVLLCCGRGGRACRTRAVLQSCSACLLACSDARRLAYPYDRSKRVEDAPANCSGNECRRPKRLSRAQNRPSGM